MAILARYGADAHLYLPGVGAVSGIEARNYLDSAGTTPGSIDNPVGLVMDARGTLHLTQPTPASKPMLLRGLVNLMQYSGDLSNATWTASKSAGASVGAITAGPGGQQSARFVTFTAGGDYLYQAIGSYSAQVGAAVTIATICNSSTKLNGFGGATPSGTDVFTATPLGGEWFLQTVVRTFTAAAAGILQVLPASSFGAGAGTYKYGAVGLFQGTVTAQQIIDAGGIPLTTTAPASSTGGRACWEFDGSNDSLSYPGTTGEAGWICAGVNITNGARANHSIFYSGADADVSPGAWLSVSGGGARYSIGNGATRNTIFGGQMAAGVPHVLSGGHGGGSVLLGLGNNETQTSKTVNCATSNPIFIGRTANNWPLSGSLYPMFIFNALPTTAERTTLRRFIGQLSGVTL